MTIQLIEASAAATTRTPGSASSPGLQAAEDAAFSLGKLDLFGANPVLEYWVDACQRFILTLDVLRQRGNDYLEQAARISPSVLNFAAEVVMDGRTFERPVNYVLVRIKPPPGVTIDPQKRPFIVFDPRAGQGPGIGGMKNDSEIGEVLQAGHPCYFVGFLENPMPGQTIEDVCQAEARFVAKVLELHPKTEGKPCLIGNCQAGWQITLMSAIHPDLVGPLLLAGAPLSYWAGVHGGAPMRYTGGPLGGTWLTALSGDLGNGRFDGAYLVANFESLKLSNTYWTKLYNVYSKVDTEGPRFLEFDKWWGNLILLNAEEMQWIADQLFVGNKLSSGELHTSDGLRVDLRNIKSPIIVFCSRGDNITPPQQALDWILDLYDHEDEIIASGQTIIYTMHQSIGHLGIFVSGKIAVKEDKELVDFMDMIDLLPPGLYEAVIKEVTDDTENRELINGRYLFSLEPRTLGDIRALGGNDAADERRFATVRAVSEANLGLYRTFLSPFVRSLVTENSAALSREMHPNRMRFEMFSDKKNPLMQPVAAWADSIRAQRKPVSASNPLLKLEQMTSEHIVKFLDAFNNARDSAYERIFMAAYDSPLLQALVGLRADGAETRAHVERTLTREAEIQRLRADLNDRIEQGGVIEAALRALIYIRGPERRFDERGFTVLKQINSERPVSQRISLAKFKEMMREQSLIMTLDQERAAAAISKLLPADRAERGAAMAAIRRILAAGGVLPDEGKRRLARVEGLFGETTADSSGSGEQHTLPAAQ
jgi:pimeloyl-ACP methyl ester carboxylesterase